jgi:GNAT superfamily N-acetyltransferase
MTKEDVPAAEQAWDAAYTTLRATHHLPLEPRTAESVQRTEARIAHLLGTDPAGSWVAIDGSDGHVVGVSQALVRQDVWVLSLLGVSPRCQDRGTGRALLHAALAYGEKAPFGLILCSRDPRAARRYSRAGFDLHPSVTAWGRVDRRRLPRSTAAVREGTAADAGFAADLARRLRGGYHGPDLEHLLAEGCRWLVLPGHGYVIASGAKPVVLAAVDETSATDLLFAVLAASAADEIVELNWITAGQQWAVRAALTAGLELHPVGPVMTRGLVAPPGPYLPSGAFG